LHVENHYAENLPLPQNYKRQTYFKNFNQCYKNKARNKHHSNVKAAVGIPLCPGKCFEEWHNDHRQAYVKIV